MIDPGCEHLLGKHDRHGWKLQRPLTPLFDLVGAAGKDVADSKRRYGALFDISSPV